MNVLYEDAALIAVDKPAGIHTAPLADGEIDNLMAAVLAAFPEVSSVPGIKPFEHGLLHRLDRGTSGVVVFARTADAFQALRSQFSGEEARKEYHALCACAPARRAGETLAIQSMFAPAGRGRRRVRVVTPEEKSARHIQDTTTTVYATEATLDRVREGRALVTAMIRKGFRHQIRAHLAFAGLPILGDDLYGISVPPGAEARMYLHASAILLASPITGKELRIDSPLPPSFLALA
jgi:23S rRNA pseudouridine1911/1915/1917 synthase